MKKIIVLALAVIMIMSMTVTASAVTPTFKIPNVPQISNIKFDVKLDETTENAIENHVSKWFAEHPIKIDFSKIKFNFGN